MTLLKKADFSKNHSKNIVVWVISVYLMENMMIFLVLYLGDVMK